MKWFNSDRHKFHIEVTDRKGTRSKVHELDMPLNKIYVLPLDAYRQIRIRRLK